MLFYSGRFFACIDSCEHYTGTWPISLKIPESDHIIVNGKIHTSSVSWQDANDGKKVYVGQQQAIETDQIIALIDQGLPQRIKIALDLDIAKLIHYFQQRLGKLSATEKPTLFASYANVDGGSSQGNKNGPLPHQASQSWLHEGNADSLAALALLDLYPASKDYVTEKIKAANQHCTTGLKDMALINAADKGQFGLYYSCGALIHHAINNAVKNSSAAKNNIYTVWNDYRRRIEGGDTADQDTFFHVVEQYAGYNLSAHIRSLVNEKIEDPIAYINKLQALVKATVLK